MELLINFVLTYLQLSFILAGLHRLRRFPVITYLIRLFHLIWLCTMVFLMFYRRLSGGDTSVGGLVGTASFVFNGSVNIIIILEAIFKYSHFKRIFKLEQEIDRLIEKKWKIKVARNKNYQRLMLPMLAILCVQLLCDGLKMWINAISKIQPVFWYTFPISISLRSRYVQIMSIIMKLNSKVEIFKQVLMAAGKRNEPKSPYASEIWQPYTEQEYDQLNYMRLIYLRIWEMYKAVNDCFSWSMLFLFMASFFDIVCNCYWTFTAIYKGQVFHKYVFNGATSMSLASLVIMLFYNTDKSDYNLFSRADSIVYKKPFVCSYLPLWIFGLMPFTDCYLIYQFYILVWCCGIAMACYGAISNSFFDDGNALNGLVNSILFLAHLGGHLIILVDSWMMRDYRRPLYEAFYKLNAILQCNLHIPLYAKELYKQLMTFLSLFACLITIGHSLIVWTTFGTKSAASMLYWRALPSFLALQFKTLEFLLGMVQVNHCVVAIRQNINEMGERNLKRVFGPMLMKPKKATVIKVLSQRQEQDDEHQVEILKTSYSDVYALFQLLNRAYGWPLLAIAAVSFVDFVCNTYWILLSVLTQGRDYYALLQNACVALLGFILLSIMCWLCERAHYESRFIGCLISKLVKPLGNKRYNDLVSEFSVQTLHQRFVITAKEFFSLNLGLLGSMVAAIVTYLVILIQFMFTEKSNKESKLSTKVTLTRNLNTTSAAAIFLNNITSAVKEVFLSSMATSSNTTMANLSVIDATISTMGENFTSSVKDVFLETINSSLNASWERDTETLVGNVTRV